MMILLHTTGRMTGAGWENTEARPPPFLDIFYVEAALVARTLGPWGGFLCFFFPDPDLNLPSMVLPRRVLMVTLRLPLR